MLQAVAKAWHEDRDRVTKSADALTEAVRSLSIVRPSEETIPAARVSRVVAEFTQAFDRRRGGLMSESNKFPPALGMDLDWLDGRLHPTEPRVSAKLATLRTQLDQIVDTVRNLMEDMRPGMLDTLGLRPEQTVYLENYGHLGQVDFMISLHEGLKQEKLKDGDLMVAIAAGIGYVWGAVAIRWGG